MQTHDLDRIDRAILQALQRNGRLSNVELAAKVGLSESACLRRVKILESEGFIEGYAMLVNPAAIGKPESVFVHVTLDSQQQEALEAFEKAVRNVPGVMECYLMSGEEDYLLRVIVRDAADYEKVHREQLTRLPFVARVKSFFTLRTVVKKTEVPL